MKGFSGRDMRRRSGGGASRRRRAVESFFLAFFLYSLLVLFSCSSYSSEKGEMKRYGDGV